MVIPHTSWIVTVPRRRAAMGPRTKRFRQFTQEARTCVRSEPDADVTPSRDDPASTVLTGYPGVRVAHSDAGAQGPDDPAAGVVTGYPGMRTSLHVHGGMHGLDDPAAGVVTGYPGARTEHSETGGQTVDDPAAGVLTGYPGTRTAGHVDRA
jgi:hypothetical protein